MIATLFELLFDAALASSAFAPNPTTVPVTGSTVVIAATAKPAPVAGALVITGSVTSLSAGTVTQLAPASASLPAAGSIDLVTASAALAAANASVALTGATAQLTAGTVPLLAPISAALAVAGSPAAIAALAGLVPGTGALPATGGVGAVAGGSRLVPLVVQLGLTGSTALFNGLVARPPEARVVIFAAI